MLRNVKATSLTAAAVLAAGCARSDFAVSRDSQSQWQRVDDAAIAAAPEAAPPKILPETYFAAARLFEAQGLVGKAIEQYRKAIAVNHDYAEAYHRLGILLGAIGRHDEAAEVLEKAVTLRPDDPVLRNNLGFELVLQQKWAEAHRELRKAIELAPHFARAHVNLGIVLSQMNRFDEALESFATALPEPDAYYNLAVMLRGRKRYEEAAKALEHTLTIAPDFTAAKIQLAEVTAQAQRRAARDAERSATENLANADAVKTTHEEQRAEAPDYQAMIQTAPEGLIFEPQYRWITPEEGSSPRRIMGAKVRFAEPTSDLSAPPGVKIASESGTTGIDSDTSAEASGLPLTGSGASALKSLDATPSKMTRSGGYRASTAAASLDELQSELSRVRQEIECWESMLRQDRQADDSAASPQDVPETSQSIGIGKRPGMVRQSLADMGFDASGMGPPYAGDATIGNISHRTSLAHSPSGSAAAVPFVDPVFVPYGQPHHAEEVSLLSGAPTIDERRQRAWPEITSVITLDDPGNRARRTHKEKRASEARESKDTRSQRAWGEAVGGARPGTLEQAALAGNWNAQLEDLAPRPIGNVRTDPFRPRMSSSIEESGSGPRQITAEWDESFGDIHDLFSIVRNELDCLEALKAVRGGDAPEANREEK